MCSPRNDVFRGCWLWGGRQCFVMPTRTRFESWLQPACVSPRASVCDFVLRACEWWCDGTSALSAFG